MVTLPPEIQEVLEKYKGQLPVPIVNIANDLQIEIYETNDLAPGESGIIRKEDSKYYIYVKAGDLYTRKRFTIAHEIGHFIKHKAKLDSSKEFIDSSVQPTPNGNGTTLHRAITQELSDEERRLEVEANEIAADLLMPSDEFIRVWKESDTMEEIANKFAVSISAATIRGERLLKEFKI